MTLRKNNEIISETQEIGIKIKELPGVYGVELSEETIKEFGEKLITLEEIEKLRIQETAEERLDTLKGLLGLKAEIDTSGIEKEAFTIKKAFESGEKEAAEALEDAAKAMDKLGESKIGTKAKEGLTKIKKISGSAVEKMGQASFFKTLEELPFIGWLFKLIGSFLRGFGLLGDKVEEVKEKVAKIKEKLKPEEIEKTKNIVKNTIENKFGKYLTKENKIELNKKIGNLTDDELNKLSVKIKEGTFNFSDIKIIIPNIIEGFLNQEQIDNIKEDFKKNIFISLEKGIKENYNVSLDGDKKIELEKLINNNISISNENIDVLINAKNNERLLVGDIFGPSFEMIVNSTNIMFGLLVKGIVPLSAFGLNFLNSSTDIAALSLTALGIEKHIKLNTLSKKIEDLDEKEKALFIALLYRKGGILFSLAGSVIGNITKFGIEAFTHTEVKSFDLLKSSTLGNYPKQIKNLQKLEKVLGQNIGGSKLIETYTGVLKSISDNYKNLYILQKSGGDIEKAKNLFSKHKIQIPDFNNFTDLLDYFSKNSSKSLTGMGDIGAITSKLGFGKNAELYRLSQRIEQVTNAQKAMFSNNFIIKGYGKFKEALNIGELSRDIDKVSFHFDSIDDAKKGLSKWNILANKSPEIIKGVFDKFPIIVIAGLAANSENNFLDEFKKEMVYLLPVIGSGLLIVDSGLDWSNGKLKAINPLEAGIGGALLTVDSIYITKELVRGGGAIGVGKYIIKPFSDLYSIGRGSLEGISYIGKTLSSGKGLLEILKKSNTVMDKMKSAPKKLKAIGILLLAGYFGIEAALADDDIEEIFGKSGEMDENILKEKMLSGEINNDEKIILLKYLISEVWGESYIEGINISIDNNNLNIESNNPIVKEKFLVDTKMLTLLGLNDSYLFKYTSDNFNYIES